MLKGGVGGNVNEFGDNEGFDNDDDEDYDDDDDGGGGGERQDAWLVGLLWSSAS